MSERNSPPGHDEASGDPFGSEGRAGSGDSAAPAAAPLSVDLGADLLRWYRDNARDLPWRHTNDPYAILVSEIMLQQTRVETVLKRYDSLLRRFPDIATLAAADVEEVLAEWSGLGYYRRARTLHAAAKQVAAARDGQLPTTRAELRQLPGVGPYTASAVASIAFGEPALALDGNVARVLCRLAAVADDPRKATVRRRLHDLASSNLQQHPPGELNQALMELGARVCLPAAPRCGECPCQRDCIARELGIETSIPPSRGQPVREVREAAVMAEHDGRYFLVRGQRPGVLQDMWELPTLDSRLASAAPSTDLVKGPVTVQTTEPVSNPVSNPATQPLAELARYLADNGWPIRPGGRLGEIRHGITDRRITCTIYRGQLTYRPRHPLSAAAEQARSGWFTLEEVTALPLAASATKAFRKVLGVDLTRT